MIKGLPLPHVILRFQSFWVNVIRMKRSSARYSIPTVFIQWPNDHYIPHPARRSDGGKIAQQTETSFANRLKLFPFWYVLNIMRWSKCLNFNQELRRVISMSAALHAEFCPALLSSHISCDVLLVVPFYSRDAFQSVISTMCTQPEHSVSSIHYAVFLRTPTTALNQFVVRSVAHYTCYKH